MSKNTIIEYSYQDMNWETCVFSGNLTKDHIKELKVKLRGTSGDGFSPHKYGLRDLTEDLHTSLYDATGYHKIDSITSTSDNPNMDITIKEFYNKVMKLEKNQHVKIALDAIEGFEK